MNIDHYINLINSSNDETALEVWSEVCKAYENDPKEEEGLIKVHKACADKLVNIINKKFKEDKNDKRTTFESNIS